jgi:hypothetical protein
MNRQTLILAVVAGAIVLGLVVIGIYAWLTLGDTGMTASGYLAVFLGALGTVALGGGLMGLLFYSNRAGYDERAGESPLDRKREGGQAEPPP